MPEKHNSILILSGIILVLIIGYSSLTSRTSIVGLRELDVEIITDNDVYLVGEEVEVSVYLYNSRITAVTLSQEKGQIKESTTVKISHLFEDIRYSSFVGSPATIPARSKILYGKTSFTAEVYGSYLLECLGERITVTVEFTSAEPSV
jgi:hypothetical protein